jgi:hypothetical protein
VSTHKEDKITKGRRRRRRRREREREREREIKKKNKKKWTRLDDNIQNHKSHETRVRESAHVVQFVATYL